MILMLYVSEPAFDERSRMKKPRGRPPKGPDYVERIRVTYRLHPDTLQQLQRAAKKTKLSLTAYVERAVVNQCAQDGVTLKKRLKKKELLGAGELLVAPRGMAGACRPSSWRSKPR
jgi:hypothetical protein